MLAEHTKWLSLNNEYLEGSVRLIRWHLEQVANRTLPAAEQYTPIDASVVSETQKRIDALVVDSSRPALVDLSKVFALSTYEHTVLLLCIAAELDPTFAKLCRQIHDNPALNYPTFSIIFKFFGFENWELLSPQNPLRYWRLIEILQEGSQPLLTSPLRVDERILNHAKGLSAIDEQLLPFLVPLPTPPPDIELPHSQRTLVDKTVHYFEALPPARQLPIVQLLGSDLSSKQTVLSAIAMRLGWPAYKLTASLIPDHVKDLDAFSRLIQREAMIAPIAIYIDNHEFTEDITNTATSRLGRFLDRTNGIYFIGQYDVQTIDDRPTLKLDVHKPTVLEQRDSWQQLIGKVAPDAPRILAGQFNFSLDDIKNIAHIVQSHPTDDIDAVYDRLWQECLSGSRPHLDTLAQRIVPKATWDDIVLPDFQMKLLFQVAEQVRLRSVVYDEWGFRQRMSRGLGMIALFSGDSGTGKTMAAEVLANALRLDLYRIDLSAVVSKYIGETEKNLRKLFDAAEDGGAILFFDEADAIFGKRSQVKDARDRYANIETNYLLQRLEAYSGLAILSSNLRANMDEAFSRRLRFIIHFPFPETESRRRIWQKVFPAEVPCADLDFDFLAKFNVAGGSIYNVALNASFFAASNDESVNMYHILDGIRIEYLKSNRLVNDREFNWEPTKTK